MEQGAIIKYDPEKAPKTGEWRSMSPEIDLDKCTGCEICVPYCPEAAIKMISSEKNKLGKIAEIDFDFCKGCGVCDVVCPVKAIKMDSI